MRPFLLKVSSGLLGLLLVFALFQSCNKDEMALDQPTVQDRIDLKTQTTQPFELTDNPIIAPGEQKNFTLNLADYPNLTTPPIIQPRLNGCADGLSPTSITATLASEESITQTLTACLDPVPPAGDILFCLDLTGSMGSALASAKANAVNIMNTIVLPPPAGLGLDAQFGVISHMDYSGSFSSCGYSSLYGDEFSGDYPYMRNQTITNDFTAVASAISALSLGWGADGPECYERAFFEAYSDPDIGWRDGAAKILVAFLDNLPHECDLSPSTGSDPGRDEIMGNGDDIDFFDQVIPGLIANNITLIVLDSYGDYLSFWETQAAATGGYAELLGEDVTAQIAGLVAAAVGHIDELTIVPTAYASWVSTDPMAHYDIDLETQQERTFDVTITVPPGTPDGTYVFELKLMGDGVEYGSTWVEITVVNVVEVGVDIHPGSCPNPLNTKAGGVIPVSICGTDEFDVTAIDPATVRLIGVLQNWANLDDDSTPYYPFVDKPFDIYSCNEMGPDGYMDLKLKFDNQEVITAIIDNFGPLTKGQTLRLILTGELYDGTPIIGEDIVKIAN